MFQTFENPSDPNTAKQRLAILRTQFDAEGIDAIYVPKSDEYLGEYIPASAERLAWATGFSGSAGSVFIFRETAAIFTDGRYTSQVRAQCDADLFKFCNSVSTPPDQWLKENAPKGLRLGLDPWTIASADVEKLEKAIAPSAGTLVMLAHNLVDRVWHDQPAEPQTPVTLQSIELSGVSAADKITDIQQDMRDKGQDALVMADPTTIAWVFNMRGNDIAHTPVALCRAILYPNRQPELFIDKAKYTEDISADLSALCQLKPKDSFQTALEQMEGLSVAVDQNSAPYAISMILEKCGATIDRSTDPAIKRRAIKNQTEIKGAGQAHLQDGVAMVQFLAWLDANGPHANKAQALDEIKVARKLEDFRQKLGENHQNPLKDISFDTISGSGPNAAIIHYRVNEDSNRPLQAGEMILIDSGGQYINGTTDITRTVALGDVPETQKRIFTLVLKGMIDLTMLTFPPKTRGIDVDILARHALWQAGLDYAHGTGHGVGSYLSVHEGPQSISRRAKVELETGMILSNEPGYYRDGAFGIRIENLILVTEPKDIEGGEQKMHSFETLTLCPIDRSLIVPELLTQAQLDWLNTYHGRVLSELEPLIKDADTKDWLKRATAPI